LFLLNECDTCSSITAWLKRMAIRTWNKCMEKIWYQITVWQGRRSKHKTS
jgi:hypothetical protein